MASRGHDGSQYSASALCGLTAMTKGILKRCTSATTLECRSAPSVFRAYRYVHSATGFSTASERLSAAARFPPSVPDVWVVFIQPAMVACVFQLVVALSPLRLS